MARDAGFQGRLKRRDSDSVAMILISVSFVFGHGRTSTRIDLKLARTGYMDDVRRKSLEVIRMVSCVCSSTTIYWPLGHMIRRSRYGISRLERRLGHCAVTRPVF